MKFGNVEKCTICAKTVYINEKIVINNNTFHKVRGDVFVVWVVVVVVDEERESERAREIFVEHVFSVSTRAPPARLLTERCATGLFSMQRLQSCDQRFQLCGIEWRLLLQDALQPDAEELWQRIRAARLLWRQSQDNRLAADEIEFQQ
jgi:hypothetical protein